MKESWSLIDWTEGGEKSLDHLQSLENAKPNNKGWVGLFHRKEKDWEKNSGHWRRIYCVRESVGHDEISPKKTQILVYQSLLTICVSKIHTFISFLCSKPSNGSLSSLKMPCKGPQDLALLCLSDFLLMLSPLFVRHRQPGPPDVSYTR